MTTNPSLRLAALATLSMFGSALAADKPNVLQICVDDLKSLLGCYGDTNAITPNIDKLAARSTLFEKAYCNQAVCSPTRNGLEENTLIMFVSDNGGDPQEKTDLAAEQSKVVKELRALIKGRRLWGIVYEDRFRKLRFPTMDHA